MARVWASFLNSSSAVSCTLQIIVGSDAEGKSCSDARLANCMFGGICSVVESSDGYGLIVADGARPSRWLVRVDLCKGSVGQLDSGFTPTSRAYMLDSARRRFLEHLEEISQAAIGLDKSSKDENPLAGEIPDKEAREKFMEVMRAKINTLQVRPLVRECIKYQYNHIRQYLVLNRTFHDAREEMWEWLVNRGIKASKRHQADNLAELVAFASRPGVQYDYSKMVNITPAGSQQHLDCALTSDGRVILVMDNRSPIQVFDDKTGDLTSINLMKGSSDYTSSAAVYVAACGDRLCIADAKLGELHVLETKAIFRSSMQQLPRKLHMGQLRGICFDTQDSNSLFLITDTETINQAKVRKLNLKTGTASIIIPGPKETISTTPSFTASSLMRNPTRIVCDPAGNLYISDTPLNKQPTVFFYEAKTGSLGYVDALSDIVITYCNQYGKLYGYGSNSEIITAIPDYAVTDFCKRLETNLPTLPSTLLRIVALYVM